MILFLLYKSGLYIIWNMILYIRAYCAAQYQYRY